MNFDFKAAQFSNVLAVVETTKILMLGVQLAHVSTRSSNHPLGKSEARCKIDGNL